jgi:hypothetical protein
MCLMLFATNVSVKSLWGETDMIDSITADSDALSKKLTRELITGTYLAFRGRGDLPGFRFLRT